MNEILDAAVSKYLSIATFRNKWEGDQKNGSGSFYALTYSPILTFFQEHQPLSNTLDLKVALVFSWNPKICEVTKDRFRQAKNELGLLERHVQEELSGKCVLDVDIEKVIYELWFPVNMLTHKRDLGPNITATKFLHFSFPDIFPMIDKDTMIGLIGSSVTLKSYTMFLLAWKNLYGHSRANFDQISNTMNMPVARVLDIMLFTPE